jgi:hypothetical protein
MNDPNLNVTVEDLRLALLRAEDWIHEVRFELESLPNRTPLADVPRAKVEALQKKLMAGLTPKKKPASDRVLRNSNVNQCGLTVPLVGPWPPKAGDCFHVLTHHTSGPVDGRVVRTALSRIRILLDICRLAAGGMRSGEGIRK